MCGGQWLHRVLAVHPIEVSAIHMESLGRDRRHPPTIPQLSCTLDLGISRLRRDDVVQALTILRNKGIEVDQGINPLWDAIRDTGNHAAPVGVTAQYYPRQSLPLNEIDDISNMGVQIDLRR